MIWPFWSSNRLVTLSCETIEPLLSLYADGMASPEEGRRVEAHLPTCPDCRENLSWMQATHQALAARPIVAPPPELHSRIAFAIAASSAAPGGLHSVRSFVLRPSVYAAAASLTVLGVVLSHSLWPTSVPVSHKDALKPAQVASKSAAVPTHPTLTLPHTVEPKKRETAPAVRVAAVKPSAPKHLSPPKTVLGILMPGASEHLASHVLITPVAPLHSVPVPVKAMVHTVPVHHLMASAKNMTPEKRLPLIHNETLTPKLPESVQVAREQPPIAVHIAPSTVTEQALPTKTAPVVVAASAKSDDVLGPVKASLAEIRTASFAATPYTKHLFNRGATNAMHAFGSEQAAYIDGIHSDTSLK